MPDQWEFKSETYDNCSCAMNCGCQFNLPSTHGYCQTAYLGNVVAGHFNETPLAGLKWAGLWKWPGGIAAGNGTRLIVIDQRADEAQRAALEMIVSGEACAPLSNVSSVYASLCEHFLDTLFLPIELETDFESRTATAKITGVLTPSGSIEFTYADLALGTTAVSGEMDMAFSDSFAMFCVHHFNQDGLIRAN